MKDDLFGTNRGIAAVSRRTVVAGGLGTLLGGGLVAGFARRTDPAYVVAADIDGESLTVESVEETLEDEPSAIELSISGGYEHTLPEPVDQFRIDLQIEAFGEEENMGTDLTWDPALEDSGSYSFEDVDLLDHSELDADTFMPEAGQTETVELTAAVEASIVDDDEYLETTRVEDDFEVTITAEGMFVTVNGLGEVTIEE